MLGIYPLRPVICDKPNLAEIYNVNPSSIDLLSACLSEDEAQRLLDQGATFDSVLLVGSDGDAIRARLLEHPNYDPAINPIIRTISEADTLVGLASTITLIHTIIRGGRTSPFFSFQCGGGGGG
jgi:hypothetical protein